MLERLTISYRDPANAQRYKFAALLIATAALVFFGVANAADPLSLTVSMKEKARSASF